MKTYSICKKTSIVKDGRTIGRLLGAYFNELQKPSPDPTPPHRPERFTTPRGTISVFGFLATRVLKGKWEVFPEESHHMPVLTRFWLSETKRLKKKGYHFVFSPNPQLAHENPDTSMDDFSVGAASRALLRFQKRFYDGDQIGAVIGQHRDKEHLHTHVLIFPRTADNNSINVSMMSPVTYPDGTKHRRDYQGFLQAAYDHEIRCQFDPALRTALPPPTRSIVEYSLLTAGWSMLPRENETPAQARHRFQSLPPQEQFSTLREYIRNEESRFRSLVSATNVDGGLEVIRASASDNLEFLKARAEELPTLLRGPLESLHGEIQQWLNRWESAFSEKLFLDAVTDGLSPQFLKAMEGNGPTKGEPVKYSDLGLSLRTGLEGEVLRQKLMIKQRYRSLVPARDDDVIWAPYFLPYQSLRRILPEDQELVPASQLHVKPDDVKAPGKAILLPEPDTVEKQVKARFPIRVAEAEEYFGPDIG